MVVWPSGSVARGVALAVVCVIAPALAQDLPAVPHGSAVPTAASATARTGQAADVVVTGVSDGDTVTAIIDGRSMRLRLGLWTDESPVPPWEWRRRRREGEDRAE